MEKQAKPEYTMKKICCKDGFVSKFDDLCPECPLREKITTAIKDKIIWQARERGGILTGDQYKNYINREIENAQEAMTEAFDAARQGETGLLTPNWAGINEYYLWNAQRVIALNSQIKPKNTLTNAVKALLLFYRYRKSTKTLIGAAKKMFEAHSFTGKIDSVVNLYYDIGSGKKGDPWLKKNNLNMLMPLLTEEETKEALGDFKQAL